MASEYAYKENSEAAADESYPHADFSSRFKDDECGDCSGSDSDLTLTEDDPSGWDSGIP
jgi:hypothetical protein